MNRQQNYGSMNDPPVGFSGGRSAEFTSLCDNVVTNIYTISSSYKTLENALKSLGTSRDNQGLRNNIHVVQLSTNQIASATTKYINSLKNLSKKEKHTQLQVEKLEGDFRDAINRYYKIQKQVADKQKAHLLVSVSIENEPTQDNEETREGQAQVLKDLEFEQDLLLERESRIKEIESDVLDINQIMRELGSMVHAQGEMIDTIENSIDHAVGNVEEGTEQLIKASSYQNRYRKKLLIIVLICVVIAAIIIGILVSELKK